jgi:hypothetical protein
MGRNERAERLRTVSNEPPAASAATREGSYRTYEKLEESKFSGTWVCPRVTSFNLGKSSRCPNLAST